MTEQEKRRRQREMERRMRSRETARRTEEKGGLFTFRVYVSAVLVGGCLLISLFDSTSSQRVCQMMKQNIAAQISAEQLQAWRAQVQAFLQQKNISLPAFMRQGEVEQEEQKVYLPDMEESP